MKRFLLITLTLTLAGCETSSDEIQNTRQEKLNRQAVDAVGLPAITKFAEKRTFKQILEDRDRSIPTRTYIVDMTANPKLLCSNSFGYPISAATQFTNPQHRICDSGGSCYILAQADPNGLYSPSTAEGTYVLCLNKKTQKIDALYSEPRVITSPGDLKDYQ